MAPGSPGWVTAERRARKSGDGGRGASSVAGEDLSAPRRLPSGPHCVERVCSKLRHLVPSMEGLGLNKSPGAIPTFVAVFEVVSPGRLPARPWTDAA